MAEIDNSALVAAGGYIYVAPVGTVKPADITDPLNPGVGYETIGHTSLDELPEIGREGDDPTKLGSWSNPSLKVVTPSVTYSIAFRSIQSTELTYQMYFGAGASATQPDGSFRIPATPIPQEKALLLVVVDGENFLPLWHPRVSLLGSDAVGMSTEGFITYPITATLLSSPDIGGGLGEWASIIT
ncbi:hypothetical protein LHJ74_30700 [Streptomyces sp. N2-109]|uniref:Major tail protein n=1 Tax=Streptomyces gossypii TaxID=2883101 RepID=A0ABT2K2A7_9ACTN|nr:hypothetical protein [Streptomyces gossypii]MCT2594226.1 hypothetical protein [Streptomyces gossypii]